MTRRSPVVACGGGGSDVSIGEGGKALGIAGAYATGTLKIRVIDALSKALISPSRAQTTSVPQGVDWNAKGGGEQTFPDVKPGRYDVTASADPALYEALLNGRGPSASATVLAGGVGVATIELMPRTWIKFVVFDTVRKRSIPAATVNLRPSGAAAPQSAATDGANPLHFGFSKQSSTCAVAEVAVAGDELYEVVDVDTA